MNGPYLAKWSGKSANPEPWPDWFQGTVYTKNPDESLILKMVRIEHKGGTLMSKALA
jgi:hypothetical protein